MATRYSGNVRIEVTYREPGNTSGVFIPGITATRPEYHCRLVWPGDSGSVVVGAPAHLTMAVDSPEAYDKAAHSALSFTDNEPSHKRKGNFSPDYTDFGYSIRRGPAAGAGMLGDLVNGNNRPVAAEELSATIGVPVNASQEILTRIDRALAAGNRPDLTLKMIEGILAPYDASRIPTFGVETIIDPRRSFRGLHGQVVAYYLNTGDPYTWHLMYDADNNRYELAAWGDWLEEYEQNNGPIES